MANQTFPRRRQAGRIAVLTSLILHGLLALWVSVQLAHRVFPEETHTDTPIEIVPLRELTERRPLPRKLPQSVVSPVPSLRPNLRVDQPSPEIIPEVVRRTTELVERSVEVSDRPIDALQMPSQLAAPIDLRLSPLSTGPGALTSTPRGPESGRGVETGRVRAAGVSPNRLGIGLVESAGVQTLSVDAPKFIDTSALIPENKLGAAVVGRGRDIVARIRIIRVKHQLSDWWQDPTAMDSLIQWLNENTQIRADMKFAGGALPLWDDRILDAPLLIMTGHDRDITLSRKLVREGPLLDKMSAKEMANLRKYLIERRGTLFFDDCGFNGLFAKEVEGLLKEVLPEYDLVNIPHDHEIYTIYYELSGPPNGADVFWGSENNPRVSPFKYQKGIFIDGRLAVIFNRKDYLCAMETAEIPSRTMLRLRRSPDVYRFMTNLVVYVLKYGGNVDRTHYSAR
ncbi:MAG: hypothetical protein KatS3mg115_1884 [Candidatus Poribacteria bacterium]|nr:MAG: hypothetical protein KatS3mg115_1884 [Candidatus Poribacteria bacterium]